MFNRGVEDNDIVPQRLFSLFYIYYPLTGYMFFYIVLKEAVHGSRGSPSPTHGG